MHDKLLAIKLFTLRTGLMKKYFWLWSGPRTSPTSIQSKSLVWCISVRRVCANQRQSDSQKCLVECIKVT